MDDNVEEVHGSLSGTSGGLFERDSELASIDAMVASARTGQARLLLLEGAAGIGKSRLLNEARVRAAESGIRVHSARGSELERDFPFGVVRQLFEGAAMGPAGADLLVGAASACRPIFASMPGDDGAEGDASFSMLHGLYWLTLNLAGDEPLLLVIDDLHWCDRPSLRFVAYLVNRLDGSPVSLVASLRPAEPGVDAALMAEVTTDPMAISLRPAALSAQAVTTLIGERLGATPDEAFLQACHEATGGNPLLLNELIKALGAEGVTPRADHIDVVQELGPRAASRSVLLRLARLPDVCVQVARALAVLGDGADIEIVAMLAGTDREGAVAATGQLGRAEIIRPGPPLGFVHPLIRAAVYGDLPPADREVAHARASRLLAESGAAEDQVASQLLPTPGRGEAWVVQTLEDAARQALGRGAPESAAAYLTRALAEPPDPAHRPELLLNLGIVESKLQGQMALEHLRAAYETTTDTIARAHAAAALAPIFVFLGRSAEGAEVAQAAIATLPPGHDELRNELEAARLSVALVDPDYMRANEAEFARYRDVAFGEDVGSRLLAGVTAYHWAMTGGPRDPCVALARHAVGDGVLAGARNGAVPYVGAQLVLVVADLDEGIAATAEAYRAAHESGALFEVSPTQLFHAFALSLRGELADAEAMQRNAQRDLDAWGFVSVRLYPGSLLARVLIERGDLPGAESALAHANPTGEEMPHNTASAYYLESRLRLLVAAGRMDEALALADDCRARFATTVVNPAWIAWRTHRAEALHRLGRIDEAEELCEQELVLARNWGAPGPIMRALRVLGSVLGDRGLDHLDEAVRMGEGTPARLEYAKALAALGTGLRLARRPSEAREPLRQALELATLFDAAPLAAHARTELQATGARPRTESLSGVGALTASERRVAEAAAQGQSNKDIAQALYVTPKTIEVHLSNAYRKLGIRSRRELAGALAA